MDIKDMRAFYAVVEEGNISHAANRLDIAQPALSRQMEETLGTKLFERGSRRIRLTEAGRVLATRMEQILGLVDGTMRELTDIEKGEVGEIRIGTITSSGAMMLPKLMTDFQKDYPLVTFEVWEAEGARILELLDRRLIEIAITRTQTDPVYYESIELSNEPLVVVSRTESALGADDCVRLTELKDVPLIVPLRWKGAFLAACRKEAMEPYIVCVSDSIVQDLLCVRQGMGAAILPASAGSLITPGGMVCRRLIEPEILTNTVISWQKDRPLSAAASRFIACLKRELKI